MIFVYYSRISESRHLERMLNYLPDFSMEFQDKIKKFRRWQDAQLSLLGRKLLFTGIKEVHGKELPEQKIKLTPFNKPYFDGESIRFNISHSGEMVVCAISEQTDMGIDIEWISDIPLDDYKVQMTDYEWNEIIGSSDQKAAFFTYWTRKEAVIKAHGEGLSIPLQSFEVIGNKTLLDEELFYVKELKIDEQYKCFISSMKECEIHIKEIKFK